MVQIYYEITIYIYKEIFPLEASPSNACLPPNLAEGAIPLYTPLCGGVYILLGCKVFMGYKHN